MSDFDDVIDLLIAKAIADDKQRTDEQESGEGA